MGIVPAAGWDHDVERLRLAAETHDLQPFESLEEMLGQNDMPAVVVAAETSMHADLVETAASAGKAIILEKPMALTLEQADRIVDAVEKANVPFAMAWQMRVDPENLKMKELVRSGELGRVFQIRRRHCLPALLNPNFEQSWHVNPELNRDIWADDASHAIDFIYWIFGLPQSVTAEMTTAYKSSMPNDHGVAIFRYADGMLAEVSSSFACAAGENTTEIVCENGVEIQNYGDGPSSSKRFDKSVASLKWFARDKDAWVVSDVQAPETQGERIEGLAGPLAEFLHGKRPPIATVQDGRNALRMMMACYESNSTGRRIELR